MRTTIMTSVKPILLGQSPVTFKISIALFLRYSLPSFIFSKKSSFVYRFLPFVSCREIPHSRDDRLSIIALDHFSRECGECVYLLIPCTEKHHAFVERNKESLEQKFIIRYPDDILAERKLFPLS